MNEVASPSGTGQYAAAPTCQISGYVTRTDGNSVTFGTITFSMMVQQVINGQSFQPTIISVTTDSTGLLQALSLPQGLFCQLRVSDNGVTYPPITIMVPNSATATFDQLFTFA